MADQHEPEVEEIVWSPRLGARLEAARQQAGLRRVDLAGRVGVSEETIRLWERGAVQPSPERLSRLIAVLAVEAAHWKQAPVVEAALDEIPELARRLRDERAARGVTQAVMAHQMGVSQATYAGWETGRSTPAPPHHRAVAEALGLDDATLAEVLRTRVGVDVTGWPAFGQLVGRRRQILGLTRAAVADRLGVTPRTVMSWELGYRRPHRSQLTALAQVLDVAPSTLVAALPARSAPSRLGELILGRQRALGLQSADLARMLGTTEPTVSRWINGHNRPTGRNLTRLAAILGLPEQTLTEAIGGAA